MTREEALKVKVGDELECLCNLYLPMSNDTNRFYQKGETFIVNLITRVSGCPQFRTNHMGWGRYATPSQVKLAKPKMTTKQELTASIKTAQEVIKTNNNLIKEINTKLQYMEETGAENFNENEFKVYQTLILLEDNPTMSRTDKAKAIASLIK
jgi:hypothetical protein